MDKILTRNEAVSLMHKNTADALEKISHHISKHNLDTGQIIHLLNDMSNELKAQSIVTALRDELKFDRPL